MAGVTDRGGLQAGLGIMMGAESWQASHPPLLRILFVCTGNSCRSQMAEAWTRVLLGHVFEPHSAGIEAHGLDSDAVKVMAEAGVDISDHRSKTVHELLELPFDCVVTLSERARLRLPRAWLPVAAIHAGFDAPRKRLIAIPTGSGGLEEYRRVRDMIRAFVVQLPHCSRQESAICRRGSNCRSR